MSAQLTYAHLLEDRELLAHLEQRDSILFKGLENEWQRIERQVTRLGFGESYIVSQTVSRQGFTKVLPLETQ